MTAVPAQVAGVKQIAVAVPPTDFGGYNTDLLAACHELGIDEVYRMGGAQGVAALAYGVEGIERVDKIVGPGNLFVALAKRFVYGEVDIDSIAGPSEVVVLADETARADFVASDLISQAEHSPGSGVLDHVAPAAWPRPFTRIGQATRPARAGRPGPAEPRRIRGADHRSRRGRGRPSVPICSLRSTCTSRRPTRATAGQVQNAGAIFLGHDTPVAVGDYVAGPSHVLPTGGTARFANGLCANDFLKRSSVIRYNREALAAAADDIRLMAAKEGLTAHSASVDIRLTE